MGPFYSILAVLMGGLVFITIVTVLCVFLKIIVKRVRANLYKSKLLHERMNYYVYIITAAS